MRDDGFSIFCMLMNVTMKNMRVQPLEGILMIMEGAQTIDGDEEEELLIIPIKQGRTNEL
jgi:hypothetical protein